MVKKPRPLPLFIVAFDMFVLGLLFVLVVGMFVADPPTPQVAGLVSHHIPIPSPTPAFPVPLLISTPPTLTAKAVVIVDDPSLEILYAKAADEHLFPASTTKIMTALISLDLYSPLDLVTVTNANESIGHKAELQPGDQFTVEDLLYALMLNSGNDAALTLAQHHPQGYSAFIEAMNQKANALGLVNTHFTNASGLENAYHYSSARDLALLTRTALSYPIFQKLVSTPTHKITSQSTGRVYPLKNLNQLLTSVPGVTGVKTGWTEQAGECLITTVEQNGHPLTLVLLGSQDRFGETEKLIAWVYQNTRWQTPPSANPATSSAATF